MDKYQEFALKHTMYRIYKDENLTESITGDRWLDITDGKITVKQDENYNIKKYYIRILGTTVLSVAFDGKEYNPQKVEDSSYLSVVIPLDFDNKVPKFTAKYNVVDDIDVAIEYEDADKKTFDDKMNKQKQDSLAQKANIKISTGADLVNVYFSPCSDAYGKTTVELYLANGRYSQPPMVMGKREVWSPALLDATPDQLIGKFEVDNGMFFKSITGLAHHAYGVKVSQFDKRGNLLFTTDYMYFNIK